MISEVRNKIKFWKNTDRIGPDILGTYWRLFFKSKMIKLCKKKFGHFADDADFRPGAYAIGCSQISIGRRVVIRPGTMLHGETDTLKDSIVIEDDVLVGCGVHIYVENHRFIKLDLPIIDQGHTEARKVILKKGCWIGANVIILPGVTIGENSVVGAGSVVTKDVSAGVVVAGNPARIIKSIGNE
ncbi:acyltransferase [Flavobacterium sp. LPB0248]|uniref:acyltransferase n=1 Tax=Flavobacterium sp. LPB0248 TaxID=2614441 RepID=UPI0015A54041|nr:acyltransferase [Flavobacterium sp. LPB0248]QLC67473.1 acyltransferase [Flavobacterium sp. LPB0248]